MKRAVATVTVLALFQVTTSAWAAAEPVGAARWAPGASSGPPRPAEPLGDDLLAAVRGRADVQTIDVTVAVQNAGTVEGNTITGDVTTGAITISDSALSNVNGLALFSLNSGNNVAINSTMTVNVAIQQ